MQQWQRPDRDVGGIGVKAYPRKTLKSKMLQITLSIMLLTVVATIISLAWSNRQAEQERLQETTQLIHESIASRAMTLARGHALALRGLVADNAYSDVRQLIRGTVRDDTDMLYGLLVGSDDLPWAYSSPLTADDVDDDITVDLPKELALTPAALRKNGEHVRTEKKVFGQEVYEVSTPVVDERGELLGRVIYGFSVERTRQAMAEARGRSRRAQRAAILTTVLAGLSTLLIGVFWVIRSSARITHPLGELTAAANQIASGQRGVRVTASSGDEVEVLAAAFNQMQDSNEEAMSKLEEAKEKALTAERLKSEFLANMSHEIRTPMNGVLGMTRLIRSEQLSPKLQRYVDGIDASANALVTVINDILDFSRLESGQYTLLNEPFDLRAVVQEVAELLAIHAHQKNLEVMYRFAPEIPALVVGDSDRLRQVVTNLVGNAVKFTESGEVFINTEVENRRGTELVLRISVTDTGIGIDPEELPRLWEEFSQVDGSAVRRHGGTGLGLAISKRLVDIMGGKIEVESELGQGSTFSFTAKLAVDPRAEQRALHAQSTDERVLFVHPSQRWLEIAEELAASWGMAARTVSSGQAALDALREQPKDRTFDVVVANATLGDMDLSELLVRIREELDLQTPIIGLSKPGAETVSSEIRSELRVQLDTPARSAELFDAITGDLVGTSSERRNLPPEPLPLHSFDPILVVDDNKINRMVVLEDLQRLGYRTEAAENGEQAVELFKQGRYSCILMDCQMPLLDGYDATRAIRKHEREHDLKPTPIIALTAHAFEGERERVVEAGMDDFLSKPFHPSSLRKLLRQYGAEQGAESSSPPQPRPTATALAPTAVLDPAIDRSALLLSLFLEQMPEQLEQLQQAVSSGSVKRIRNCAHKIKGSCLTLAAPQMAATADEIQKRAEAEQLHVLPALVLQLNEQHRLVRELVEVELAALPAQARSGHLLG